GDMPSFDYFMEELKSEKKYQDWLNEGKDADLFLDSFDEGIFEFKSFANFFIRLLTNNKERLGKLCLRISCRTAVWPEYFEKELQALFGEKQIAKYELCPLTRADVVVALQARGISKDLFLNEVNEKEVFALAGKPLTLELLMSIFEKNNSLPTTKVNIYTQGCNLLVQEPDPSKKTRAAMKPKLSLSQRMAIAERIAAATILGGKMAIVLEGSTGESEVHIEDLYGKEILDGLSIIVEEDQIREVLNTGLFSARGNSKVGWAHQTYGEFLAAKFCVRHQLSWGQLQKLLFHDPIGNNSFQVVPQLYEVAAWLASMNTHFFDKAVITDPEFLLLTDASVMTNSQKKALTEQLLLQLDRNELFDRWETFNNNNYKKLCHPKITEQLLPYIQDTSKGIVVRRSAIDIASACKITSLDSTLPHIVLDKKDNLTIRSRAAHAIAKSGSDESKKSLRALLGSNFNDDPEDELKGAVLEVLWPDHISIEELFTYITPPKKHNFFGAYHGFTDRHFVKDIRPQDVLVGLDWVEKNAIKAKDLEYTLRKLADGLLLKAWQSIDMPGVLEKFAKVIYARLKGHFEVISDYAVDDEIATSFQKSMESADNNRQRLIRELINLLSVDASEKSGRKGYILLPHGHIQLIYPKDLPWLIEWSNTEKNDVIKEILAEIIYRIADMTKVTHIELVREAREKNSFLKTDTHFWFEPVNLDSESATEQRKRWNMEQKWMKKRNKNENEELFQRIPLKDIEQLLEKAEAGDTDSWWRIHNALCLYQSDWDEEDIQKLPGWKVLDTKIQERIIRCGKEFILKEDSKPEKWLGIEKIYFPALAGYRGLSILYEQEREFVEGLSKEVWKKWAPIVIGMPVISNHPDKNSKLVTLAYKNAPNEIINTLDRLIDDEEKRYQSVHIIGLLDGCADERMSKFLLGKVQREGFNPKAFEDVMHYLLKHKVKAAKDYVKSLIKVPLSKDESEKEKSLVAAVSLLWNADSEDWKYIWGLIKKNKEFGHLLIDRAHDYPDRGSGILQQLSEHQLAELYLWLMNEYPPEKYFRPEGFHTVTPQISISEWRDTVLRVLVNKGTAESYKQVKKLAAALPQQPWLKQFTLIETKRIALEKSWQPLSIKEILNLTSN
ncbi:MAG TPA: hypothetical protein VK338_03520, partial [Candidatus Nitrosocosmicus sp.]|nr:hypothetical protein [Candidatus Nitrosocosmicus sp.]